MHVPKYVIFIVGLGVAVAAMFGFSYLSSKNAPVEPEVPSVEQSSSSVVPKSPFAVVSESAELVAEPESGLEVNSEDSSALLARIIAAENRIEALEEELAEAQLSQFLPEGNLPEAEQQDQLSSLFEPATVSAIQSIRDDNQLQRLDLRDRAIREGWINTDRFRDESRALRNASQLRETLGDEGYDKLLIAEGRDNRVRIESVIENSAADSSGIQVGDTIIRYADDRIFQFRDLRDGTTAGQRDESVTIQVSRNGEVLDLVIPRGPMGVTLTGTSAPPLE